jgi:hypothetical protein
MLLSHVTPDAFLHLLERAGLGRLREKSTVNVFKGVSPRLADNDSLAIVIPLEHRAGPNPEPLTNHSRNRNLTLGGEL